MALESLRTNSSTVIEFYIKEDALYCMYILRHFKLDIRLDAVRMFPCSPVEVYKIYVKRWNILNKLNMAI